MAADQPTVDVWMKGEEMVVAWVTTERVIVCRGRVARPQLCVVMFAGAVGSSGHLTADLLQQRRTQSVRRQLALFVRCNHPRRSICIHCNYPGRQQRHGGDLLWSQINIFRNVMGLIVNVDEHRNTWSSIEANHALVSSILHGINSALIGIRVRAAIVKEIRAKFALAVKQWFAGVAGAIPGRHSLSPVLALLE